MHCERDVKDLLLSLGGFETYLRVLSSCCHEDLKSKPTEISDQIKAPNQDHGVGIKMRVWQLTVLSLFSN